jgi:hypothetical protein
MLGALLLAIAGVNPFVLIVFVDTICIFYVSPNRYSKGYINRSRALAMLYQESVEATTTSVGGRILCGRSVHAATVGFPGCQNRALSRSAFGPRSGRFYLLERDSRGRTVGERERLSPWR